MIFHCLLLLLTLSLLLRVLCLCLFSIVLALALVLDAFLNVVAVYVADLLLLYHVPCTICLSEYTLCMHVYVCVCLYSSFYLCIPHCLMKPIGNSVNYLCKFLNGP